jgi:hypothetical protein
MMTVASKRVPSLKTASSSKSPSSSKTASPEIPLKKAMSTKARLLSFSLLVLAGASPAFADTSESESSRQAMARMKAAARYISSMQSFSLEAHLAYDVSDDSGRLVEEGEVRRMMIRRPDRARVEVDRRSGSDTVFTANGKQMTVVRAGDDRYAQEAQPGNLDHVVDAIIGRTGMRPPLINLFYSGLWQVLKPRIERAEVIGVSTIDGVDCDHLFFENHEFTWQIWIDRGTRPLPRRIVTRYTRRHDTPTLRADITKWEDGPKLKDKIFELKPPKGAKKVSLKEFVPKRLPAGR